MAALNSILFSALSDYNVAERVEQEAIIALGERRALPNHPALFYVGDLFGSGTNTLTIGHDKLMGTVDSGDYAEGASITNIALTTGKTSVTVGRRGGAYEITDRGQFAPNRSPATAQGFVLDAMIKRSNKLTDVIADTVDGFTTQKGVSGADLSPGYFMDATIALEANNAVQAEIMPMSLFHSHSWGDIKKDLAEAGNAYVAATPELAALRGTSFKGTLYNVPVFVNNRVKTINSGADYANAMWVRGGVCWADMSVPADPSLGQLSLAGKILFEKDRNARAGETAYVHQYWLGASKGIDLMGVVLVGGVS